ncbi:MAG: polymerase sigma factor FliA [Hydrocarboniphaga sp.]|uniref:RNA polymerase sigma factor FliA n=1 Tax=Hydrocarboniphaga sp. TaxID=2033016 RepID=UPI00260BE79D|nr:RNA polymerase sigma factor FliA [Hydrocarboniphaga sp.]MDB5972116.1 polymerase sigma factor FliA [Hydrocarboniphaga sp.]
MNARTSYTQFSTASTRNLDPKSEAGLVQLHADLVKRIAFHVAARLPSSVDVEDLIQAGVIGLIEAARHYNGDRGASFETYAGIRIRGAMMDELRRGDWAPRSVHRRHRDIAGAMKSIGQREGRAAREDEVIAELSLTAESYRAALQDAVQCQVLSLDEPPEGSDDPFEAADTGQTPLEALERDEFHSCLARAIASLPEREKMVLSLYYDDEMNLREIGAVLDVSESRVCQIHGQALLRVRAQLQDWAGAVRKPKAKKSAEKSADKSAAAKPPAKSKPAAVFAPQQARAA